MLNFNLFENIHLNFKCLGFGNKKSRFENKIYDVDATDQKVSILPITTNFDIDNLYPLTNHVELWNILIIGSDKTYILANIKDPHIKINHVDDLCNRKACNILPEELEKTFDSIWDKTLKGNKLQFYMVWNSKLYFVNTYPFLNDKSVVNGAIMFMRTFDIMPELKIDKHVGDIRMSFDRN